MSLSQTRPTALIDFRSPDEGAAAMRLAFGVPRERLQAASLAEVMPLLARVDALARAGAWCVGYVHYEAAGAFDPALKTHAPGADAGPLAAFAVYDAPLEAAEAHAAWAMSRGDSADVQWRAGLPREPFDAAVDRIHCAIADGQVYQVNLTAPLEGTLEGDPLALFAALRRAQPNAYAAFLDITRHDAGEIPGEVVTEKSDLVLSVSPELFFDWREGRLLARPMKGTAARGVDAQDDAAQAERLASSPKERAENLMIVDLLRNDLSRLALPFSVKTPRLFQTEAWPTVWQMSSDVVARTRDGLTLADVFGALFPSGSVTGAPKVQAMRLIEALETGPRGVYCGAVGVVQPGGTATFNVPIRTLSVKRSDKSPGALAAVRCGIGSGITADATAAAEWDEWRHKRAFVDRASEPFELLETLRLQDGRFGDVPAHLDRMEAAARYFGFDSPRAAAQAVLDGLAATPSHAHGAWRVRVLGAPDGTARVEAFELPVLPRPIQVRLARAPLLVADSEFVRFKTTRRAHYDRFAPTEVGVFDTLLWNERLELTEFTRGNVALLIGGRWRTPAARCGLLPGIERARLLRDGRIEEDILTPDDLGRADAVAFFNSLRGWMEADIGAPAAGGTVEFR